VSKISLLPRAKPEDWLRPSVLALIAANLIPLAGVFLFDWEVFPLLLLFWFENVIIGFFNALKMLCAAPDQKIQWAAKLFIVPFFCFHYGMFTFVHGVFVVALFGGGAQRGFPGPATFFNEMLEQKLLWAVLGLFASHAISFAHNYLLGGEYRRAGVQTLMMQPYGRIVVLHITILLGGFLMMALKSPTLGLALLVVLKIALDLRAHLAERAKFASEPKTDQTITTAR
jgi:hypothetical protein